MIPDPRAEFLIPALFRLLIPYPIYLDTTLPFVYWFLYVVFCFAVIKPNYGVNKIKNESFEGENTTSLQDDLINLGSDDVSPLTEYNDTSSSTDSVNQFMNQLGNQESGL